MRRGLAPLEQIRRELARLARGEIPQLPVTVPDEVRPLVAELNRLLELLGHRQQRARHALGNLAHALKTPLTALTQLAEQPPPSEAAAAWWPDLRQQIQQIRTLTEREMKRARIVGGGTPGTRRRWGWAGLPLVCRVCKLDRSLDSVPERGRRHWPAGLASVPCRVYRRPAPRHS